MTKKKQTVPDADMRAGTVITEFVDRHTGVYYRVGSPYGSPDQARLQELADGGYVRFAAGQGKQPAADAENQGGAPGGDAAADAENQGGAPGSDADADAES
ncbi:MAG TPA: hypothetical protein VD973_28910 [Symbiobacteriaceae bacterium]|nr:hypothetical protein [Symbiobacteriaceae bacterium]